ncbi:hypothetical protein L6164_029149 [Bauhinia variegata]|uniref:Uncharacterized protein n=1 Tax=Bauhinia variegata TaxID=167791 RepID=A0ACB9L8R4_BAUVA|nr:hypothetical protein L6164_029149 [Bauhinia variegata]
MRSLQFCYPILLHLFLFHLLSDFSSSLPLCRHDQSSALLHFKNSFSLNTEASEWCDIYRNSPYPKTASWQNGSDCCLWDGVTCDTISGNVIGLDLSCSWLQGTFHQNSTFFQLTHLQTLNLAFNDFNGSPMPSHFGGLQSLVYLNLSQSKFAGKIPSTISRLSKLVSLDLSWNYDDLRIKPIQWKKLVQNATNLRELVFSGIDMSSIKPSSLSFLMNLS